MHYSQFFVSAELLIYVLFVIYIYILVKVRFNRYIDCISTINKGAEFHEDNEWLIRITHEQQNSYHFIYRCTRFSVYRCSETGYTFRSNSSVLGNHQEVSAGLSEIEKEFLKVVSLRGDADYDRSTWYRYTD